MPFGLIVQVEKALASLELAHQILDAIQRELGTVKPPVRLSRIRKGSLIINASIPKKYVPKLFDLFASGRLNQLMIDKKRTVALDSLIFPTRTLRISYPTVQRRFEQYIHTTAKKLERRQSEYKLVLTYLPWGALRARCFQRYPSAVGTAT